MRRLSSKWTFFYKKIFPLLWFVIVAGMAAGGVCTALSKKPHVPLTIILLVVPAFLSCVGYALMKNLVFDLLDEVWDEGDSLVLVKGDMRETVRIEDIINVSDTYMINPPRITLLLRQPCRFGREVAFMPVTGFRLNPFKKNAVAQELLARVHKL
jgi:hypothetical protein